MMSYPGDGGEANGLMPVAAPAKPTAPQARNAIRDGAEPPEAEVNVLAPAAPSNDNADPMLAAMEAEFNRQKGFYEKLREARGRITVARESVDSLVKLGDMITQDDVVSAAAKLVAVGIGAEEVAGLLADMPPDGPTLQAWIAQQDAGLREREAQLTAATQQVRFALGTSALQALATHSMLGTHLPPENPLMGGRQ